MSLWEWIADRTILAPSSQPIANTIAEKIPLSADGLACELWRVTLPLDGPRLEGSRQVNVLKFLGAGGRAERISAHPLETWPAGGGSVYGLNPPGYGQTPGRARVQNIPATALASYQYVRQTHPCDPLFVTGNSLGCVSALFVASQFPVAGLLLRNPPPIHQLIRERPRYNAWNFGAGRWVARQFPGGLDALETAARCRCPALFICSDRDRLVPPSFQQRIIGAYAGPIQVLTLSGAGHHSPIPDTQAAEYKTALQWLYDRSLENEPIVS